MWNPIAFVVENSIRTSYDIERNIYQKREEFNMNYTTPEQKGVSSAAIKKYIDILESNQVSTHEVILARGEDIYFEKYKW